VRRFVGILTVTWLVTFTLGARAAEPETPAEAPADPPIPVLDLPEREAEPPEPLAPEPQPVPESVRTQEWVRPDTTHDPRNERPVTKRRWYGWQTLVMDAVSIGLILAALDDDVGNGAAIAGLVGYGFGAPIVHVAHGQPGKAFASLGLRVGAPFVGARFCGGIANCTGEGGLRDVIFGLLSGAAAAITIDAAVIANEDVEPTAPRVSPSVGITKDRATFSLGGVF
jgi:hypothetical protein